MSLIYKPRNTGGWRWYDRQEEEKTRWRQFELDWTERKKKHRCNNEKRKKGGSVGGAGWINEGLVHGVMAFSVFVQSEQVNTFCISALVHFNILTTYVHSFSILFYWSLIKGYNFLLIINVNAVNV